MSDDEAPPETAPLLRAGSKVITIEVDDDDTPATSVAEDPGSSVQTKSKWSIVRRKKRVIQVIAMMGERLQVMQRGALATQPELKKRTGGFCGGIIRDLKTRWPHYASDFKDGVTGPRTISRLCSAIAFLYFACLLPAIAFGVLNQTDTDGAMTVEKILFSQAFGGIVFALIGGQPLIVMLSTAPLALFIKVIYDVASANHVDFLGFYAWVGLWNCFFLIIYSVFELSFLMHFSRQSTEETFAFFITIAFMKDGITPLVSEFQSHWSDSPSLPLAYMILLFGTVIVGLYLLSLRSSVMFGKTIRELISDYALPISVVFMSFIGSYAFRDIPLEKFTDGHESRVNIFILSNLGSVSVGYVFIALPIGFALSLLFFMDQNISSAMVNNPRNELKKGASFHWDLFVVAIINIFLSLFGLPWVHAALPHSPLHMKALGDITEVTVDGQVHPKMVNVRETRLSGLISHLLILFSIFMYPTPLKDIPMAVLYGLFVYVGWTALDGNQYWNRLCLIFMSKDDIPSDMTFVKKLPAKQIHIFTLLQTIALVVLCVIGFAPSAYVEMCMPVALALMLPLRHLVWPKFVTSETLKELDGEP